MYCVELAESFPTSIYLQKSASIQPRTSTVKFARSPCTDPPGIPRQRERAARYRLPHRDIFLHNDPEQHHARDYDGGVQRIPWRRCAIQMVENQGLQLLPEYENTWIVLVV